MAAIIGAGVITGAANLGAAGIGAWMSVSAQRDAMREHRRAEALRIKFAGEETEREVASDMRRHGLESRQVKLNERTQNFNEVQAILDNITSMHNSNSERFAKVRDSFGSRRQRR